jgi:hypothetical protein
MKVLQEASQIAVTGFFWLDFRYTLDEQRRDPWGSAYELGVATDSVMIISYGPDRVRATEDDFSFVTARGR